MHNITRDMFYSIIASGIIGDAVGYAVEFDNDERRMARRIRDELTSMRNLDVEAQASDDTQMTLINMNSLVWRDGGFHYDHLFARQYMIDWAEKQIRRNGCLTDRDFMTKYVCDDFMVQNRAPGNACLTHLARLMIHDADSITQAGGSGAIMRVAPFMLIEDERERAEAIRQNCHLTHQFEDAVNASISFVEILRHVARGNDLTLDHPKLMWPHAIKRLIKEIHKGGFFHACKVTKHEGWDSMSAYRLAIAFFMINHQMPFDVYVTEAALMPGDSDTVASLACQLYGAKGAPLHWMITDADHTAELTQAYLEQQAGCIDWQVS